jgi:tRNA (guanine10-N2)-dimethyltransferase
MKYLFAVSKDHPSLALSEIRILFDKTAQYIDKGLIECTIKYKITKKNKQVNRLGLTKNIYEIKKEINNKKIIKKTDSNKKIKNDKDLIDKEKIKEDILTYFNKEKNIRKITQINCENIFLSGTHLFNEIKNIRKKKIKKTNLQNKIIKSLKKILNLKKNKEKNNYLIYSVRNNICIGKHIWEQQDKAQNRRSHLKKYNHPTSIHPKLAKVMNNLANVKSIHDPFCGAGGILIEGILQKYRCSGGDISKKMISFAKLNAKEFGINQLNVSCEDFFLIKKKLPSIVTDLPYGKNSTIKTKENKEFYHEFFLHAQTLTKNMVVGIHQEININQALKNTSWKLLQEHDIYIHKSMTRKILVLRSAK